MRTLSQHPTAVLQTKNVPWVNLNGKCKGTLNTEDCIPGPRNPGRWRSNVKGLCNNCPHPTKGKDTKFLSR